MARPSARCRPPRRPTSARSTSAHRGAVLEILVAIGEDPDRDGLVDTPGRVAHMYVELFAGFHESPHHHLEVSSRPTTTRW